MKITVNTEQFKDMVSKAVKGAGNDKLMPITQFMGIRKFDTNLILTTTDATNYLYVCGEVPEKKSQLFVTVFVDQFSKLISKMTSENITLEVVDKVLTVSGNGTYSIELPLDEEGALIQYPDPAVELADIKPSGTLKLADVHTVLDVCRPSLATDTANNPELINYFVGDSVIATDQYKIASFNTKLLDDERLISPELMNLLDIVSKDTIDYKVSGDSILFVSDDIQIYGKLMSEEYPVDVLEKLLNEKFPSVCKVNKQDFLNLLDRMALFVSKYDDKAIKMSFTKEAITVTNKAGKSSEVIEYQSVKKHKDFNCTIDIEFLTTQIKAYASDVVEMHYGKENSIKLVDGNITQVIALNEE